MTMSNELETLYSRASDTFEEMISDMQLNLLETNDEYNRIDAINRELRSKNPKISLAFDREDYKDLTANEFKILVEILEFSIQSRNFRIPKACVISSCVFSFL